MASITDYKIKTVRAEEVDDVEIPTIQGWDTIPDRPRSLADLSHTDGERLDTVESEVQSVFDDITIRGWSYGGEMSAVDNDTVQWNAGTLKFSNGTTYSISLGNTGNMAAITYIYFDPEVSETTFQTTTNAADAVGPTRLLIGVAQNVASGKDAIFQAFGGKGTGILITADNIAANSITANEIQTNTITTLNLTAGTISGMTITGGLFRTASSGIRIEMSSSDTNQIRFYDSSTLYGQLEAYKIGSDGYIGLIAQDDGAGFEVYTGVGASAFSSASIFSVGGGFSTSGNASNGFNTINGKFGGYFGVFGTGGGGPDYISTDLKIDSSWTPTASATYDLGTTSLRWRNGWLSGNLTIGGNISATGSLTAGTTTLGTTSTGSLTATSIATSGSSNHLTVGGNAFLRLRVMSGATADGLSGVQDGAMYVRSDDNVIRVRLNGTWRTITTS